MCVGEILTSCTRHSLTSSAKDVWPFLRLSERESSHFSAHFLFFMTGTGLKRGIKSERLSSFARTTLGQGFKARSSVWGGRVGDVAEVVVVLKSISMCVETARCEDKHLSSYVARIPSAEQMDGPCVTHSPFCTFCGFLIPWLISYWSQFVLPPPNLKDVPVLADP